MGGHGGPSLALRVVGPFSASGGEESGADRTPSHEQWGLQGSPQHLSQSCHLGFCYPTFPRKLSGHCRPCPGDLHLALTAALISPRVEASWCQVGCPEGLSPGTPPPTPHLWVPLVQLLLHPEGSRPGLVSVT